MVSTEKRKRGTSCRESKMRGRSCLLLAVTLFLVSFFTLSVGASEPLDREVQKLLATIGNDSPPRQTAEVCGKLFKDASPDLSLRFKYVGQTGVALRAAWEKACLVDKQNTKKDDAANVAARSRFLGFVEGRLGIPLPPWWEEKVRGSSEPGDAPFHRVTFAGRRITMPESVTVEQQGEKVLLHIQNKTVVLPPEVSKYLKKENGPCGLSASMDRDVCFLAFPRPFNGVGGVCYPLVSLDPRKGKINWDAVVWDYGMPRCLSINPIDEQVSIVENGDRVFVFGSLVNIEAFDRKTGANEFRFAAGSW